MQNSPPPPPLVQKFEFLYHNDTYLNGFTTLGESDYYCLNGDKDLFATDYAGSLWDHFTRVSPLFDDLWTGGQGGIYAEGAAGTDDDEGRFVATWWEGQHYPLYHGCHGASYFQASNVFGLLCRIFSSVIETRGKHINPNTQTDRQKSRQPREPGEHGLV